MSQCGLGRHLTDEGFVLSIESKAREEAKAKEKDKRSETQKLKRAARDACEDEWKQIMIRHDNTVSVWKTECGILKVAGT